jgi:hypothetical protein
MFESRRLLASSCLSSFTLYITKTPLEIRVLHAYQTLHLVLNGLRHSCIFDVACNVYMA